MTTSRIASLSVLAISMAVSSLAQADSGLSRAQVKAELVAAQRSGDLPDYETGKKLNELFPTAYPSVAKVPTLTAGSAPAARTGANTIGDMEYDAVAQRNAEAVARRAPAAEDNRVAGKR